MRSNDATFEEARAVLAALGMPKKRQKLNPVCTFLAFADIGRGVPWASATNPRLSPADVLRFRRQEYGPTYAENARESIRRAGIYPFMAGGILERNPDAAGRPVHSMMTKYALTAAALGVIRLFGTPRFEAAAAKFRAAQEVRVAPMRPRSRRAARAATALVYRDPIRSPHNVHGRLEEAIVRLFVPTFAAGARTLYRAEGEGRAAQADAVRLARLGVPARNHQHLPDLVLHDPKRKWLLFVEAVTIGRPASVQRHERLLAMFATSKLGRVHVLAFPTFHDFNRWADGLSWDTEVWIAEAPERVFYFSGDRLMGPR